MKAHNMECCDHPGHTEPMNRQHEFTTCSRYCHTSPYIGASLTSSTCGVVATSANTTRVMQTVVLVYNVLTVHNRLMDQTPLPSTPYVIGRRSLAYKTTR